MKHALIYFLLFILISFPVSAQEKKAEPRLVVGIMVDGLQQEHVHLLWNYLDAKGLKSIMGNGAGFQAMKHNIVSAGNAADIATIVTGTTPNFHGISGNKFFNRRSKEEESVLFDENQAGIGTYEKYSAHRLLSSTITDEIILANPNKSRSYTVAIDPEAAIMLGGHTANSVAWIDDIHLKWVTTGYYEDGLTAEADRMNMNEIFKTTVDKKWQPLFPANSYLWNFEASKGFTYNPADKRNKGTSQSWLKNTPAANSLVTELATRIIKTEQLGKSNTTDILMLQYSVRIPNELFTTTKSMEKEDMYLRFDQEIKQLLEVIQTETGISKTLIVLFANKSGTHTPMELGKNKIPAGYFNANRSLALLNTYLMALYGRENWVEGYSGKNIFLNRRKIEEKKYDLTEIQQIVADFMIEFEGVRSAYTAAQIQNQAFSSDVEAMNIRNSYHKNNGGDVVISLLPGWLEVDDKNNPVGEVTSLNTNIPVYFYGWHIQKQEIKKTYYITDIAPTISRILNVPFPNACVGKPIEEIIR